MRIYLIVLFGLFFFTEDLSSQNRIVVSKKRMELYVINSKQDTLCKMPCGIGKNYGNKMKKGDNRTPEGTFDIVQIQNAKKWTHNFNDGFGERKGAYGPWFIRLKVPRFSGIGIHGTCFPESVGTRCSEGCIRLKNNDLLVLKKYVYIGMKCTIEKD